MAGEIAALNVLISGDAKPLTNALNEAKGSLINFSNLANSLEQLRPFSPFIVQAIESAKSVGQLNDALAQLKIEQAAALDPKELQAYNAVIKSVGIEIKSLSAAGTTSGIQSIGKSFTEAFSGLRQIAYILPGIGIAGIFNLAFEAISKAATALDIFGAKANETALSIEDYTNSLYKINDSEIAHAQVLLAVARDNSAALDVRKNAVDSLQRLYPDYLGNLSQEKILTGDITTQVNNLTQALLSKALAEAAEKKLAETGEKIYDITQKRAEATSKLTALQNELNAKIEEYQSQGRKVDLNSGPFFSLTGQIVAAKHALDDINSAFYQADLDQAKFLYDAQKFGEAAKGLFITPPDAGKGLKTISDILTELRNKLQLISQEQDVFGTNLNPERISAIKSAINELLGIKVSPTSDTIKGLIEQIDALQAKTYKLDLSALKGVFTPLEAPAPTKTPVVPLIGSGDAVEKNVKQNLDKAAVAAQKGVDKINAILQRNLSNTFENLAVTIGESLASIFTGKESPLQVLGQVLGEGLKALGKQLIQLGIESEIIQKAIKSLLSTPAGPFALIAGGIALEAIGSAVSNLGVTPHAEGGIFDKPTLIGSHLFGEAGPEALLPLNRLPSMLGNIGSNQKIEVTGTIGFGYDKLLIAINRANQFTSRNYGNFSAG